MAVYLSLVAGAGAQFFTDSGTPLTGGLLYTYAAGTTTPLATYTDSTGVTANTNPIVLNSAGRVAAEIWLTGNTNYKFVLKTATLTTIGTYDNISTSADLTSLAASNGSSLVTFLQAGTGAVARTVQSKERDVVSVKDFGAVGDGIVDDTVAIQAAVAAADSVLFPKGSYLSGAITLRANMRVRGDNATIVAKTGTASVFVLASNCKIQNVKITGTNTSTASIYGNNVTDIEISQIDITGGGDKGIWIDGSSQSSRIRIENSFVTGCTGQAINFGGSVSDIVVNGCVMTSCQHGVQFYGEAANTNPFASAKLVANLTVTGCVAKNMTGAGFWGSRGSKITFAGNVAETCGDVGFDFEGVWFGTMIGNAARDCVNACYSLFFYSQNITLTGNVAEINRTAAAGGVITQKGFWITAAGNATDVAFKNIVIADNVVTATHGSTTNRTDSFRNDIVAVNGLIIKGNIFGEGFVFLRKGARSVRVSENMFKTDVLTAACGAVYCEGLFDFDISNNTFMRTTVDPGATRDAAAIYTLYVDATYKNERYSVFGNRVSGWNKSFADDYSGAGRSYALVKDNLVTGTLERSGTGAFWQGDITSNYSAANPATAVTETTY
jgi:hypothetical protein